MFRQFCLIASLTAAHCLVSAHPMGNFSINHYARFDAGKTSLRLTYALDLAEIPTFELLQSWKLDGRDFNAVQAHAADHARHWLDGVHLRIDGQEVKPRFQHAAAYATGGAGGLPVLRVVITATVPSSSSQIEYEDTNYPARTGWKEIVVVARDKTTLEASSHSAKDRSHELSVYPTDPEAPPQDIKASFRIVSPHVSPPAISTPEPVPSSVTVSQTPSQQPSSSAGNVVRGDYLSTMLGGREITLGMMLTGLCIAFGLGAIHALSPGHGKTIVAAYLVGSRCNIKHAAILGAIVTFTHTVSVFLLGLGVLFFEQSINADKAIPLLGAVSGLSIVVVGVSLLYSRTRALQHSHDDDGGHHHTHGPGGFHFHTHAPGDRPHSHIPQGPLSFASLIALGVSGGLVPCPSALVLLLSAITLGRTGLGLMLLIGFSAGLALVLMTIGVVILYAKDRIPERVSLPRPMLQFMPVFSAAVVMILGIVMTGVSLGWIRPTPLS